jgi:hypothetical protein
MTKASKKSNIGTDDFIPMERTRALISEIWDHWRNSLEHSPDTAKRMINAAIDEMYEADAELSDKVVSIKKHVVKKAKATKKSAVKKVAAKKTSLKSSLKKAKRKAA